MLVKLNLVLPVSCLMGGILLPAAAVAIETANPYEGIVQRNAFGLKPAPPVEVVAKKPTAEEKGAKVFLTGITELQHQKKAWFTLTEGKTPNAPAKFVSLKEGQKSGDLEVLEIHEKKGEVKVLHFGEERLLSFKESKSMSVPINIPNPVPAAPVPGVPVQPARAVTSAVPEPQLNRGRFGRQPRGGGFGNGDVTADNNGFPQANPVNNGFTPISPVAAGLAAQPAAPPLDAAAAIDQAVQNVNAQRQAAAAAGGIVPPPLPEIPTELPTVPGR